VAGIARWKGPEGIFHFVGRVAVGLWYQFDPRGRVRLDAQNIAHPCFGRTIGFEFFTSAVWFAARYSRFPLLALPERKAVKLLRAWSASKAEVSAAERPAIGVVNATSMVALPRRRSPSRPP
jgi:hypothetical protein